VVHRDLKLENFLYDQKGSHFLKLIDFGFSKFFQESSTMHESLGTINYIAPEVLRGMYSLGSCDMWSLGVIVFVLLAGYMPFSGRSDSDIIRAIRKGKFIMHDCRWRHISDMGKDFVTRLLVVKPGDRMTAQEAMQHPWVASCGVKAPGRPVAAPAPLSVAPSSSAPPASSQPAAHDVAQAFLSFARASKFQQACMQMMAWTLPLEERRRLRDTFLEMDTTHTGTIELSKLNQLLKEKYRMSKFDRAAVCKAVAVLDVDNDGEVHYSDFLAVMMAPRLKQRGFHAVEEAFRRFDKEGLGYLTEEGLWQMFSEQVSRSELGRIFRLVDVDGDGKIDLEEFADYLHAACDVTSQRTVFSESKWRVRRRLRGLLQMNRGAAAGGA